MLRFLIGIAICAAMLVAQIPFGFAQHAVSPVQPVAIGPAQDAIPGPAILEAFKAYPKGGDQLSKVIEDLIVSDPQLAPGLAKHLQTAAGLNKEQKRAAFLGLAAALNWLQIRAQAPPRDEEEFCIDDDETRPPDERRRRPCLPLWPPVLGALIVGGGIFCIAFCFEDKPVSP